MPDNLLCKCLLPFFPHSGLEAVHVGLASMPSTDTGFLLSLAAAAPAAYAGGFHAPTVGTAVPSIPDIMATESNRW
jgi:hypothetical protein